MRRKLLHAAAVVAEAILLGAAICGPYAAVVAAVILLGAAIYGPYTPVESAYMWAFTFFLAVEILYSVLVLRAVYRVKRGDVDNAYRLSTDWLAMKAVMTMPLDRHTLIMVCFNIPMVVVAPFAGDYVLWAFLTAATGLQRGALEFCHWHVANMQSTDIKAAS
jgi:phosphatidylglycerophosphate synthase